jgi:hypothetical protein
LKGQVGDERKEERRKKSDGTGEVRELEREDGGREEGRRG